MRIEGFIKNKKNSAGIPGTITAIDADGKLIGITSIKAGESYYIDGAEDYIRNATLITVSPGFKTLRVLGDWLANDGNIYLERDNTATILLAGGAAVAVAVAAKRKNKGGKRKVGSAAAVPVLIESAKSIPTPVWIGAGVVGFFVLKGVLEGLGIWDTADEKALKRLSTDPNNAWNPNFWTTKPATVNYTNPIDAATAIQYARDIKNGLSWVNDNESAIKSVFKRMYSQATVSFVAYYFQKEYGEDLLQTLIGGWWPNDGLSDSDVTEINNYIFRLPKY